MIIFFKRHQGFYNICRNKICVKNSTKNVGLCKYNYIVLNVLRELRRRKSDLSGVNCEEMQYQFLNKHRYIMVAYFNPKVISKNNTLG